MATTLDDFLKLESMAQSAALIRAKQSTDPIAYLDLKWSIDQSSRISGDKAQRAKTLEEKLKLQRAKYFNELKAKSSESLKTRRSEWTKWFDYFYSFKNMPLFYEANFYRAYSIQGSTWYSSRKTYDSALSQARNKKITPDQMRYLSRGKSIHVAGNYEDAMLELKVAATEHNSEYHAVILHHCFPSVVDYLKNPSSYPYLVAFMEEVPWPNQEQIDAAYKKIIGWGTHEYAQYWIQVLRWIARTNMNPQASHHYILDAPKIVDYFAPRGDGHRYGGYQSMDLYRGEGFYIYPKVNSNFDIVEYVRYKHVSDNPKIRRISRESARKKLNNLFLKHWGGNKYYPDWGARSELTARHCSDRSGSSATHPMEVTTCSWYTPLPNRWDEWPKRALPFVANDMGVHWFSPRPKEGHFFIPKIGYVNPLYFTPANIRRVKTVYQFQKDLNKRIAERRKKSGGFLSNFISDPIGATGDLVGTAMKVANPWAFSNEFMRSNKITEDIFRETEKFTGGLLTQLETATDLPAKAVRGEAITEQDWINALDVGAKIAVIAASGGSATSLIGVTSGQLQRGSLGKEDWTNTLLKLGEVSSVAYLADSSVSKAVGDFAKDQAVALAKKEVIENTDLEKGVIGSITLEVGAMTTGKVLKGSTVAAALNNSLDKGTRLAIAKSNPYAAMILAGVQEIEKHGMSMFSPEGDKSSPEGWFDSFDVSKLGDELKAAFKRIDSKDFKRLIGVGFMVASGRLSGKDAMLMIGQEIGIRQIDRFYDERPIYETEEEAKRRAIYAEVQKYKEEERIYQKVVRGEIPSPNEIRTFLDAETTDYLWTTMTETIPEGAMDMAWRISFDIGLPDFEGAGVGIPEWAKIGSVDMPPWSKIKVKQEYRDKINEKWNQFQDKQLSKLKFEEFLYIMLINIWPPGVPLRRPGARAGEYNFVDANGFLNVREELSYRHDHPMLTQKKLPRHYTAQEIEYNKARELELSKALAVYKKMSEESDLNNTTVGGLG